ncbi:MAG: peptidyl-prolyl cis-trans isomerase [Candidatus Omnitrophica bacterium]|nr:peptidyl-prolyl cis-trans isomerase [Candidatus Omnitrophota bacterium]
MSKNTGKKIKVMLMAGVVFFLAFAYARAEDKIVAIVNSDVITQKDLNDFINFTRMQMSSGHADKREIEDRINSMKGELLDKLIEDKLILQEAKKSDIKIDESRVQSRIDELRKYYGSETDFQADLVRQGLVRADLESRIKEQMLMYGIINAKIRSKVIISPAQVTEFYEENKEAFKYPEELVVESLSTEDADGARQIFLDLRNGKDPESLVKAGLVYFDKMDVVKGQLRRDIEEVIFKLKEQEVSAPVKIGNKYYIFKLTGIIPARQQSLVEVRDKAYTMLFNQKMEEGLTKWLDELKSRSYIKIFQN